MTTIVGLTGGIAAGKTTIINHIKKKRIPIHDSDAVVNKLYAKPPSNFLKHLKKINLQHSFNGKKINKNIIRGEIFYNQTKKKLLEKFIHSKVAASRKLFLKKHKNINEKIVFLDIPLLFEKKLDKICDYVVLIYAPQNIRKKRAIRRKGMTRKIFNKIIANQFSDTFKKSKADFVINTSINKSYSYKKILEIINKIKYK